MVFFPARRQHRVRPFFIQCFSRSCSLLASARCCPLSSISLPLSPPAFLLFCWLESVACRWTAFRLLRLVLLTAVVAVALDLPGLAILGIEHSLHIAMTVAYLLGLVRFVRRGRCDWWWFVCILIQPIIRFEAAGMLVADALIFVAFRRYGYALATLAIGLVLVGGYSLFLYSLGLPLLPSSVLSRSDWSNAALVSHSGFFTVFSTIVENLYANLRSFGAAQMLGGVALAMPWLGWIWTDLWTASSCKVRPDQAGDARFHGLRDHDPAHRWSSRLGAAAL